MDCENLIAVASGIEVLRGKYVVYLLLSYSWGTLTNPYLAYNFAAATFFDEPPAICNMACSLWCKACALANVHPSNMFPR